MVVQRRTRPHPAGMSARTAVAAASVLLLGVALLGAVSVLAVELDTDRMAETAERFKKRGKEAQLLQYMMAAREGDLEGMRELLQERPPLVNDAIAESRVTGLMLAAARGHLDIIELLVDRGAEVRGQDVVGSTAVMFAAMHDQGEAIHLLHKLGANVDTPLRNGQTPLIAAAAHGKLRAATALLDLRAFRHPVDERGMTALWAAITKNKLAMVKLLLERGLDADYPLLTGETPVMYTCGAGKHRLCRTLVKHGADLNVQSKAGTSLAHMIATLGKVDVFKGINKLAPDETLDVNLKDKHGLVPLHIAASKGKHHVVKFLLKQGVPVDVRGPDRWTALHFAASRGKARCAQRLLKEGAKINAVDINGTTPLMLAAMDGNERVVRLLLEKGANVKVKNKSGNNAASIALLVDHSSIVNMLHEAATGQSQNKDPFTEMIEQGREAAAASEAARLAEASIKAGRPTTDPSELEYHTEL